MKKWLKKIFQGVPWGRNRIPDRGEMIRVEHQCTCSDLVWGNKPTEEPDGECISIPVTCRICGKKYEEVYSRNDGLWDPDKEEYVPVPASIESYTPKSEN